MIKLSKKIEEKVWKIDTADGKFSKIVRDRDKKCLRCGRIEYLQCSHFWSRQHWATRFDLDNCITLCYPCHYGNNTAEHPAWEYEQQGEYRDFMIKRLGIEKYNMLEQKHRQPKKKREAILEFMKTYETIRTNT